MLDQNLKFIIDSLDKFLPASQFVSEYVMKFLGILSLFRNVVKFGESFTTFLLCLSFTMSGHVTMANLK